MATSAPDITFERHYSVEELGERWKMSDDFIRRLFLREHGRGGVLPGTVRPAGVSDVEDSGIGGANRASTDEKGVTLGGHF